METGIADRIKSNALKYLIWALTSFVLLTACQTKEKAYEDAIYWYYFETNKNAGAGRINVASVKILESIKINDTTFVLAQIEGSYTPPPLPTETTIETTDYNLWFLMVKQRKSILTLQISSLHMMKI
jgi:hypothetical protein